MVAVVGCAVSCFLVLGFYGYVFMQLYREHKRFGSLEKRLHEHFYVMEPDRHTQAEQSTTEVLPKTLRYARKESLIDLGVAIGGLLGVFAEIEFLNLLVNSFH
jgi:hypothetical protein